MSTELIVVGGGLAGSEAAWQAAEAGIDVATSCSKLQLRLIKDEAPHQESSNIELCPVAEVAGWPRPTAMSLVSGFQ